MAKKEPAKRRVRGTGTIFQSKRRGVWVGRVLVGKKANGKPLYVECSDADQRKLVEKMKLAKAPGPETTVGEWADRWLLGLSVRSSTNADCKHTVKDFVKPELGHIRLRDLTAGHVEAAAKVWSKRLGVNTLRKTIGQLGTMLRAAKRSKLIPENPVSEARKPRGKRKDIHPFPPADLVKIMDAAAVTSSNAQRAFALIAGVGCRLGESVALDVRDFSPTTGTVAISRTYSKAHGMRATKTENGIRTIEVPARAIPAIVAAIGSRKSGPIFLTRFKKRQNDKILQVAWRSFLKRLGIPYRSIHQLRHSIATAMISNGVPPGDIARYLGDTVETIVRVYLHPTGARPVLTLNRLFE